MLHSHTHTNPLTQQAYKLLHLVTSCLLNLRVIVINPCRQSVFPEHSLSKDTKFPDDCNPPQGTPRADVDKWTKKKGGCGLALFLLPCFQRAAYNASHYPRSSCCIHPEYLDQKMSQPNLSNPERAFTSDGNRRSYKGSWDYKHDHQFK